MWSYTQLEQADRCLYLWYRVYVDKVKAPPTKALAVGDWVHQAIARLRAPVQPGEVEAAVEWALRDLEAKDPARRELLEESDRPEVLEMVRSAAEVLPEDAEHDYAEMALNWPVPPTRLSNALVEAGLPPLGEDEVEELEAHLDRVWIYPDHVEVRDWKTGGFEYEVTDPSKPQVAIYGAAALFFLEKPVWLSLHFLRRGAQGVKLWKPRSREDLVPAMEWVAKAIAKVRAAEARQEFPATPNELCRFCHLRGECPAWRGRMVEGAQALRELRAVLPRPIADREEAKKTAKLILLLEQGLEAARVRLEAWTREHGHVQAGGEWFGLFPRNRWEWDEEGFLSAAEELGFEREEFLAFDKQKAWAFVRTREGRDLRQFARVEKVEQVFGHQKKAPEGARTEVEEHHAA